MRRWLPAFRVAGTCRCTDEGEQEGRYLEVIWCGFVVELHVYGRVWA